MKVAVYGVSSCRFRIGSRTAHSTGRGKQHRANGEARRRGRRRSQHHGTRPTFRKVRTPARARRASRSPTGSLLLLTLLPFVISACGGSSSTESTGSTTSDGTTPSSGDASRIRDFGHEVTGSQAHRAEAAVLGYLHTRAAEQWSRACSYLSKSARSFTERIVEDAKQTEGAGGEVTDCAAVIREVTMLTAVGLSVASSARGGP